MSYLIAAVGAVLIAVSVRNSLLAYRSKSWSSVVGSIDDVTVRESGGAQVGINDIVSSDRPRFWQDVLYRYEVESHYFTGTRKRFGLSARNAKRNPEDAEEYTAGSQVIVYYVPGHPAQSVLMPGLNGFLVADLMGGIALTAYGVWLMG